MVADPAMQSSAHGFERVEVNVRADASNQVRRESVD